jgi:large subunit ribosomal protein L15
MELHNLKSTRGARKARKRVGRGPGSGTGKTSGRGHKGAQSRSGYSRRIGFEGGQMPLHRRLPKRGFNHQSRWPMAIVNLDVLESNFDEGAEITSAAILKAGLARAERGGIKVLGRGEVKKKFTLKVQAISPSAQTKIEAAGGSIELIVAKDAAADSSNNVDDAKKE